MQSLDVLIEKTIKEGLMSKTQYLAIIDIVKKKTPCNFLVFGLGNDSYLWDKMNTGGKTVFIEDNEEWIKKFKNLSILTYKYDTEIKNWKELINQEEKLLMNDLPENILSTNWDLIIVDGPVGHPYPCIRQKRGRCDLCPCPGRMKSIFTASKLCKNGIIIVDDYSREVEKEYTKKFINTKPNVIENKVAIFQVSS